MNPLTKHNQDKNPKNFGEVDFEDHQLEIMEEDCNKVNKELEENEIPIT